MVTITEKAASKWCQTCNLTPALGASKAVVLHFSNPLGFLPLPTWIPWECHSTASLAQFRLPGQLKGLNFL